ncbi:MAG: hypothetical protein HFJ18_03390 [Clostridia bacterium]|nr:hypothetical protein [Clostridia bacterium]MCI8961950.1 hypothetical protein [Clostridia bacterium]
MIKKFYGGKFIDKEKLFIEGIKHPIKVEYYKIYDNTENEEITQYGLEVVKTEYNKENINIENKQILKVTKEEKVIDNILDKLKNNEVTPIIAKYIVEDLVYNL